MELQRFFDGIPILAFLGIITVLMVTFFELGFRVASKSNEKTNKAQIAQVRAIMGAALGLLAFMLAFSFSGAKSHFEARVNSYLLEISAIDSAYRGADLLDENHQSSGSL